MKAWDWVRGDPVRTVIIGWVVFWAVAFGVLKWWKAPQVAPQRPAVTAPVVTAPAKPKPAPKPAPKKAAPAPKKVEAPKEEPAPAPERKPWEEDWARRVFGQ